MCSKEIKMVPQISVPKGRTVYELQDKSSPHWGVNIGFADGSSLYKEIPNDHNNKQLHEEHVLELFLMAYAGQKWDKHRSPYTITGRDGQAGQRHDFCVHLSDVDQSLAIEIIKLGDSHEVHLAHTLRDTAAGIIKRTGKNFFVYADSTTKPKDLREAIQTASTLPPIYVPSPHEDNDNEMRSFIENIETETMPYVRLVEGETQIHTKSTEYQSLREAVQQAIWKKERKDYSPHKQEDMILVIDDKSLRFSREYIDLCAPLLNYCFVGSRFKEIYIISRKNSASSKKKSKQEVMFTPVKSNWHPIVFKNIVSVAQKINEGQGLLLNF